MSMARKMAMWKDFDKRNDREDVFTIPQCLFFINIYCPAILFICECASVCVMLVSSIGPMGTKQITSQSSTASLPLQTLGLNNEAKKRGKVPEIIIRVKKECLQTVQSCILFCINVHSNTLSCLFNDDFTKTVFIIRKDKEYLFTRKNWMCSL